MCVCVYGEKVELQSTHEQKKTSLKNGTYESNFSHRNTYYFTPTVSSLISSQM